MASKDRRNVVKMKSRIPGKHIWFRAGELAAQYKKHMTILELGGEMPATTRAWLETIPTKDREKLRAHDYKDIPIVNDHSMAAFVELCKNETKDKKESTRNVYKRCWDTLLEFFGNERDINDINRGEAKKYAKHVEQKYDSEATAGRQYRLAVQMFNIALDYRWIDKNEFVRIKCGNPNKSREKHYVEPEWIERVIDVCDDDEWRFILTCARYCGVRFFSELLVEGGLRWDDIDFEANKMKITGRKTGEDRESPIWPEVKPYLLSLYADRKGDYPYVIKKWRLTPNRKTQQAYDSKLKKLIRRAAVDRIPAIWVNCRSSFVTDRRNQGHDPKKLAMFTGHSEEIADHNYAQLTPEDFHV